MGDVDRRRLLGGSMFVCRHCHNLAYERQRETTDDREMRRVDTIRRRLDALGRNG